MATVDHRAEHCLKEFGAGFSQSAFVPSRFVGETLEGAVYTGLGPDGAPYASGGALPRCPVP